MMPNPASGRCGWAKAPSVVTGVRSYWRRQWAMVDPHVEPVAFAEGSKAEVIVQVHQVVRDLKGNLLADKMVGHIFQVDNGLVRRFDIRGHRCNSGASSNSGRMTG